MVKFTRSIDKELYNKVPREFVDKFLESSQGKQNMTLYGGITKRKATKAFLYHMVSGKSYLAMERATGIKHSNCVQIFGTIRSALFRYSRSKIRAGLLSERRAAAKKHVQDQEFADTTLVIDSSDFKLQNQDNFAWKSEQKSYKESCHAARYQFIASHDRILRYVSGPFSPKIHDSACVRSDRDALVKMFPRGDVALADLHYSLLVTSSWKVLKFRCKKRKPRSRKLTVAETSDNKRHCAVRNKIEGVIGDVKNRFSLVKNKYRRSIETQHEIIIIASAIHNCVVEKYMAP